MADHQVESVRHDAHLMPHYPDFDPLAQHPKGHNAGANLCASCGARRDGFAHNGGNCLFRIEIGHEEASDEVSTVKVCEHYWAWVSPAGTKGSARICIFCHQPDPEWLNHIVEIEPDTCDANPCVSLLLDGKPNVAAFFVAAGGAGAFDRAPAVVGERSGAAGFVKSRGHRVTLSRVDEGPDLSVVGSTMSTEVPPSRANG